MERGEVDLAIGFLPDLKSGFFKGGSSASDTSVSFASITRSPGTD